MIVNLTKEQIEFINYLCYNVGNDYEYYSVKEQKEREAMASDITCAIENAKDESINEDKLDELAKKYRHSEEMFKYDYETNLLNCFKAGYHEAIENYKS